MDCNGKIGSFDLVCCSFSLLDFARSELLPVLIFLVRCQSSLPSRVGLVPSSAPVRRQQLPPILESCSTLRSVASRVLRCSFCCEFILRVVPRFSV
jgi:hypothetical protein